MKQKHVTLKELLFLFFITLVYSYFALTDLGDMIAPTTLTTQSENDQVLIWFDDNADISTVSAYMGPTHKASYMIEILNPMTNQWIELEEIEFTRVFAWNDVSISLPTTIRITCLEETSYIMELAFLNSDNEVVLPLNAADYPNLFDESNLYPSYVSFRNGTYFDECYHARTAYEFLHGIPTYEISHPPLGKIIISIGIAIFGMNPFGFRIMGTLFGILMIPIMYFFARKILKNNLIAGLVCVLFTFDFMHFAQTRIATIDVYVVFFIILMFYCMYIYCEKSYAKLPFKETLLPLGLSGFFMSLAIASKWQGVYAAVGLALVFFISLYNRRKEKLFVKNTVLFCFGFFVGLPLIIYTLSYLPFVPKTEIGFFQAIIENQEFMFTYHSGLEATHPYSSPSYSWPIIWKPIWYFNGYIADNLKEGISSFGNPLVWWASIPAFFHVLIHSIKKKDKTGGFLIIGFFAQYLPWVFISRVVFIYHYFPSVIFLVLIIGYSLKLLQPKWKPNVFFAFIITYGILVFALFILFYPVLAGQPIDPDFVVKYLRWLPEWVLIMPN